MGLLDSIGDAVSGAFGDIASAAIGGGLSFLGQSNANQANQQMAQNQMAFQERMDNTKYQRTVKDLEAAGLNPMMAYGNMSAGSPSGALGVGAQNTLAGVGSAISGIKPSEITKRVSETKNVEEQNRQIQATTAATEAQAKKSEQETRTNAAQELINLGQLKVQKAQIAASTAAAARDVAQAKAIVEDTQKRTAMGNLWNVASDVTSAVKSKFQNLKEYSQKANSAGSAVPSYTIYGVPKK